MIINNDLIKMMLSKDQLLKSIKNYEELKGFTEFNINFMPTYKFEEGKSTYDQGGKKRVPSYWDRILLHNDDDETIIKQVRYESVEILWSDHMPVVGHFNIRKNKIENKDKEYPDKSSGLIAKKPQYDPHDGAIQEKNWNFKCMI